MENEDKNDIFKYGKANDPYFGDDDSYGSSWNTTPIDWNIGRKNVNMP